METIFGIVILLALLPVAIFIGEILLSLAFISFCWIGTLIVGKMSKKGVSI